MPSEEPTMSVTSHANLAGTAGTAARNGRLWGIDASAWSEIQEPQLACVYEEVLRRAGLEAGHRYLDIGCGSGLAAVLAAGCGATVSGLDAADGMLAVARARLPGGEFVVGELEALPYASDRFDLVTGFNSFQFAARPAQALMEARRVARSGGGVAITTWAPPQGMEAASLVAALKPLLPAPLPSAPGPFALSDVEALQAFAASAGLTAVDLFDMDCPWVYPDLHTALRGLASSGVARMAIEHTDRASVDHVHRVAIRDFVQRDGSYRVMARFRCLLTRA